MFGGIIIQMDSHGPVAVNNYNWKGIYRMENEEMDLSIFSEMWQKILKYMVWGRNFPIALLLKL